MLASGSAANSLYLDSGETRLLIDAGLSARETARRCGALGIDPARIDAICLSHEHEDHRGGLRVLHRRFGMALYANAGTLDALGRDERLRALDWRVFTTGQPFAIGNFVVEAFSVPHDSYDPVGFVVTCDGMRVGIVTDMGMATGLIREKLKGCRLIVMEANYDDDMLRHSDRPWTLKQRIIGRQGHLSNAQAGELLCEVADAGLRRVLLAHLSEHCNRPEIAMGTVRRALAAAGHAHIELVVAAADRPTAIIRVE